MNHPWERVPLSDYENHMKLDEVYQLQQLNSLMKAQLNAYSVKKVAILGVAGGNGLEHVNPGKLESHGRDSNEADPFRGSDPPQWEAIDSVGFSNTFMRVS